MTARGECRLILWQHYDMIILLAQWYSIFRQNNSILINEHALTRKTVHGYVLWVTSRVGYLITHGLVPSHRLFEIIHIKIKILKEKNLDFFSLNFFYFNQLLPEVKLNRRRVKVLRACVPPGHATERASVPTTAYRWLIYNGPIRLFDHWNCSTRV